jgi:hypothetical protein
MRGAAPTFFCLCLIKYRAHLYLGELWSRGTTLHLPSTFVVEHHGTKVIRWSHCLSSTGLGHANSNPANILASSIVQCNLSPCDGLISHPRSPTACLSEVLGMWHIKGIHDQTLTDITVVWFVTPSSDMVGYHHIAWPCSLNLQHSIVPYYYILNMETSWSSETLVSYVTSPWRWRQHGSPKRSYPTKLLHTKDGSNMELRIVCIIQYHFSLKIEAGRSFETLVSYTTSP